MKNARRIVIIFLSALSGVCFGVALSTFLLTNGYLSKTYRAYIVQSGSMEPSLPVGSVVLTRTDLNYASGDIITFTPENSKSQVTHRIVSVENENAQKVFSTKGDANEEADSWKISESQILGKSFLVLPKVGYLADFVRTPKGFVILVVIPASIIIYEEFKAVLRELKRLFSKKPPATDSTAKTAIVIPILGSLLLLASATTSFAFDREVSKNSIQAAETIEELQPEP